MAEIRLMLGKSAVGIDYGRIVRDALDSVGDERLKGLSDIMVRDRASLTSGEKKQGYSDVRGVYNMLGQGRAAKIHVFVDNIWDSYPEWATRCNSAREFLFLTTLFHELAHHVLEKENPDGQGEDQAKELGTRMLRQYYREEHPILWMVAKPFILLLLGGLILSVAVEDGISFRRLGEDPDRE